MMSSLLKDRINSKSPGLGPITARIRPGVKVPTKAARKAAEANPELAGIFKDVEEGRLSSRKAEKRITDLTQGSMKYPFTPRNTPYFNVSASDFSVPELGGVGVVELLRLYGEERPEAPGRRLWRIPMVFSDVSDVEKIFPSEFRVGQGANMYRSEYLDGKRYCMIRPAVDKAANAKRKHQQRIPVARGLCDPDNCAEFGSGACKFHATLRFHIPGFPGIAPFVMGTSSTYAAEDMYLQLQQVIEKLGRIPRTKPDGSPVFWLVKSQKQRSFFDENGEKATGLQWVPDLIADIDFPKMLAYSDSRTAIGMNATAPKAWLAPTLPIGDVDTVQAVNDDAGQSASAPLPENAHEGQINAAKMTEPKGFAELAAENGIQEVATKWAALRFGDQWARDHALSEQAKMTLSKFLRCGKGVAAAFFDLMVMIFEKHLDYKLADAFLRHRLGAMYFKNTATIRDAKALLADLLESGVDVAQAYMRNEITKVA